MTILLKSVGRKASKEMNTLLKAKKQNCFCTLVKTDKNMYCKVYFHSNTGHRSFTEKRVYKTVSQHVLSCLTLLILYCVFCINAISLLKSLNKNKPFELLRLVNNEFLASVMFLTNFFPYIFLN